MSGGSLWKVKWDSMRLTDPTGEWIAPRFDYSPIILSYETIAKWEKELSLWEKSPVIDGYSLWWRIRYQLHMQLQTSLPYAHLIAEIAKGNSRKITRIELDQPPFPWWKTLFSCFFPNAEINFLGAISRKTNKSGWKENLLRLRRAIATFHRMRYFNPRKIKRPSVLILSHERSWNGEREFYFDTAIQALDQAGFCNVIMATAPLSFDQGIRSLKTRHKHNLFTDYITFRHLLKRGYPRRTFAGFPNLKFSFQGADLSPFILSLINRIVSQRFQEHIILSRTFTDILKKLDIKACLMIDENGGNHPLKIGCRNYGIPSVALQHGSIFPGNPAYSFPEFVSPNQVPLCDVTCVWGQYYKDVLTKQGIYPEENVVVTGQVQMDHRKKIISKYGERGSTGESLRKRLLPSGCDRILFLTSQYLEQTRNLIADIMLKAFSQSIARNFLVIRPHPAENNPQIFWKQMISKYSLEDRVLIQSEGSFEDLMDACDIHISAFSASLNEATVFGRYNIILSKRLFGDFEGRLEAGVAVNLEDFHTLDQAVDFWLEASQEKIKEFHIKQQKYLLTHFHHLDGKAGERVCKAIIQAMDRNKTDTGF
ncbi:hypothetical protein JW926_17740 [Candidatus Sumerlaeota bacterium]|nr:hypothetical protein [Candidatus Sumerlaeota bacterium]